MRGRFLLIITVFMLFISGCSVSYNGKSLFIHYGLNKKDSIAKVAIQYLSESKGDSYLTATLSSEDGNNLSTVTKAILNSQPSKQTNKAYFSAPLHSTHRILIYSQENNPLVLYYSSPTNLLTYVESIKKNKKEIITYHYLTPTENLKDIFDRQKSFALLPNQRKESLATLSQVDLVLTISKEDLLQQGTEIEYDLFENAAEEKRKEPFYHVYTQEDGKNIPEGKVLITAARGEMPTDGYEIDIERIESNDQYIKVYVSFTDPGKDDVTSNIITYPAVSIISKASDFPTNKPVVFLDDKDNILAAQKLNQ